MNPNDTESATASSPIAFCQNCGKSLTVETVRKVGSAVYCEPCLEARLTGNSGPLPNDGAAGAVPPPYTNVPFATGPNGQPIAPPSIPNPGLAALLGVIPGVGAMYNEQYAKGLVHLGIFAVLMVFSNHSDFVGLFAFGWICYMSIEAHHTAKARRDGTPLPNPFGFNDIGERMGFNKTWPATPAEAAAAAAETARDAAAAVRTASAGFNNRGSAPSPAASPFEAVPPEPSWGAPTDQFASPQPQTPPYNPVYAQPYAQPYAQTYAQPYGAAYGQAYAQNLGQNIAANAAGVYETRASAVPPMPPMPVAPSRFPTGAIFLIALGLIFLLGTLGLFNAFPGTALVGIGLLVLGVFVFFRRMTDSGEPLAYDGSPAYHLRILRALRSSIWLVAIGILALLSSFRVANLRYTWPWLIILVGVMMLLQRAAYNSAADAYQPYPGAAPAQPIPPFEPGSGNRPPTAPQDTTAAGPGANTGAL